MKAFDQSKDEANIDIAALLAGTVSDAASSRQVAHMIASTFGGIDQALTPIIGQRGVAALYKRSLHLAGRAHPWLAGPHEGVHTAMDVAALTGALAAADRADCRRCRRRCFCRPSTSCWPA